MSINILSSKKKAQIKMFESVAVIIVFFFLVAIGLRFYGGMELNNLEQAKDKFNTLDSIKMAMLVSNLPELKCSTQNVEKGACVDYYKVKAWGESYDKDPAKSYYFEMLGHSTITLEEYSDDVWKQYVLHNKTPNGNFSSTVTPLPVTVWNPLSRRHNLGVLYVKVHNIV